MTTNHLFLFERAMTPLQFSVLCVLAVAVGCKRDATFQEPIPPQSALHWVHAVPDTGAMDMRPIDIVTNAGLFDAVFRGSNMFYQGIDAGSRRIRIFMSSTDPAITGTPILDTVVTVAADNGYTLIHTGFARTASTPARTFWVVPDAPPSADTATVGIRVLHAGAGMPNVDVWVVKRPVNAATVDSLPDARTAANVAYKGAAATYVTRPRDAVAADSLRVVVTAAGTKSPVLASVKLPAGTAGTTTNNPIAGARIGGSVITAVIVPPSVAGSAAPSFTTPSAVFLVDRRPPNTIPPAP